MPDLADLPAGSRVFVDTNIFDLAYRAASLSCVAFLERVARGEVAAYVNVQVLSDLLHKLMLAEAVQKGYISTRNAQKLKEKLKNNRALATMLVEYQQQFEQTLAIGLRVLSINEQLLIDTHKERSTYGLMTGDSLHLGTMNRCRERRRVAPIRDLVTQDGDFAHITDLTIWEPSDVVQPIRPAQPVLS